MFFAVASMILTQLLGTGLNILFKMAHNVGFNLMVLIVYRYIAATVSLVPLALIVDRGSRPPITWKIVLLGVVCGLFGGTLSSILYAESFGFASASFVSAISNLFPGITFIMALIFRLEKVDIRSLSGQAKVAGTAISIGGAMLATFYAGSSLHLRSTSIDLLQVHGVPVKQNSSHVIVGMLLTLASCVASALALMLLTLMTKSYPGLSSTAMLCTSAAILSALFTVIFDRSGTIWWSHPNIGLVAATYSGIFVSGFSLVLTAWCARIKGPVFVSAFSPLSMVFTILLGPILLQEELHIGSIIGGLVIVIGVYVTLWGQYTESAQEGTPPRPNNSEVAQLGPAS